MTPDDPRHGTATGYTNRCREACCRAAKARSQARYRRDRHLIGPLLITNLGVIRRLQALAALGWTPTQLGPRLGMSASHVWKLQNGWSPLTRVGTHRKVAALYRDLCMTVPPDSQASRTVRANAARLGWFPPLSWDDIDDPDEEPPWRYLAENEVA